MATTLNIPPIDFIESKQGQILRNIEKFNSGCDGNYVLSRLRETITALSAIRDSNDQTKDLIIEVLEETAIGCKAVFENWLLKSTEFDRSYYFARAHLIQKANSSDYPLMPIPIQHIDEDLLMLLVQGKITKEQLDEIESQRNEQLLQRKYEPEGQSNNQEEPEGESKPSTCQKVESAFEFMLRNDPRKHKVILNESDFKMLIDWVTYYFENTFSLPDISTPIRKVNTSKGNVVFTFFSLFKQEYPTHTRPDSLFELIKACFFEYRDDNIKNLRKTREPQYYQILVSKSE